MLGRCSSSTVGSSCSAADVAGAGRARCGSERPAVSVRGRRPFCDSASSPHSRARAALCRVAMAVLGCKAAVCPC